MQKTADQALVKKLNKSIVLETIRKNSPISRAQTAQCTGLNKATVSSLVQELIDEQLLHEIGFGPSNGGRKPMMLLFNKTAGFAIGVDLGVHYLHAILTDLEGNIVERSHMPLAQKDFRYVYDALKNMLNTISAKAPPSRYGIVGAGIGVPGIVDDSGTIQFAPNLNWENIQLRNMLKEDCQFQITIENEANAGALGEKHYGVGRQASDLVYLSVGTGIGSGIIVDGQLFRGFSGYSGEIGHTTIEASGKKCPCGNKGCWELYASEKAAAELAASYGMKDFSALIESARQDRPEAIHVLHQIGQYLGIGIVNIINTFNPKLIVIGNQMIRAEPWIRNAILRITDSRSLFYHRKHLQLEFAALKTDSTVLGAAYCAISGFFEKNG